MSNHDWHPSDTELFLHLEGELDGRPANRIAGHLVQCWDCRLRRDEFERGVRNFVEYRRDILIPQLPPSTASVHAFRSRLPEPKPPVPATPWRITSIASGISLLLIAALLAAYVLRPPSLTAAELLHNAAQASNMPVPARKVKAQRIQIRQGSQMVEREIVAGRVATLDAQWNGLLANLPVDARDPLNPAAFERWHAAQSQPKDRIEETDGTITLQSTVPLLEASLVVRRADWHAIAERFTVAGQPPIEIREIAMELRNEPPIVTTHVAPAIAPAPRLPDPSKPSEPPIVDWEAVELDVREILRRTGADRIEVPTIVRDQASLTVEALAETAQRREELTTALMRLSHVEARIVDTATAPRPSPTSPPRQVPPAFPTNPPLAKALWDYTGSMDRANAYLDSLRSQWFRTMGVSNALERLAARYPQGTSLTPDTNRRLVELVAAYQGEVGLHLSSYLQQLNEPLDAMLRLEAIGDPAPAPSACRAWQETVPAVREDLEAIQTAVRRLFLVDYAETEQTLSASQLLRDAAQARARLRQQQRCFQQP